MAYNNSGTFTSIFGRRFGLSKVTTALHGGRAEVDLINGPDDLRVAVTTAESTGTNLSPWGYSNLPGTSVGSSAVYTIDPPIPGVRKIVTCSTENGPIYLKTKNSETFLTTLGSTHTTIKASTLGGAYELIALTTARWLALNITSGTSSQAGGFALTTST